MLIGLTGGAGSGKSTVAEYLRQRGAIILSGDEAGKRAVDESVRVRRQIREAFGDSVFNADGSLRRRDLGYIVFSRPEQMQKLNAIVHPPLLRILKTEIGKKKRGRKLIVVDAALIFEWGIADWFDYILVVTARRNDRIQRMTASGLTRREAEMRIRAQIPDRDKVALADYVIRNDGTKSGLWKQVERFLAILRKVKK